MNTAFPTRRTVLAAAGTTSAALALAACGSSGGGDTGGEESPGSGDQPTGKGTSEPGGGGAELVSTSEVPEGGGTILKEEKVVVTQPSAGEYKAFSAVCTHQGCVVSSVADGSINCACHGSRFAVADGSVQQGPATQPLPAVKVSVRGGSVRRS
ncbi:Rieske (2Fe-2S) protein [Streptomyces sp. RKND-216]|uniref:Rieske (2Fe-2S) protein n=1 Tax=Streptomyces sp. RKND-216 TaxID=2562581 RepID=UPI00109DFF6F|nr:Rieske (2Fe-2S) protein [Streptomyces sp. RKND-216]THA23438.1 Rieske (2Fe-2S) protein [Streptomyces sp. RKND-216]